MTDCTGSSVIWTGLRCSRCRYSVEHPGPVSEGDLDRCCALCGAMLEAVRCFGSARCGRCEVLLGFLNRLLRFLLVDRRRKFRSEQPDRAKRSPATSRDCGAFESGRPGSNRRAYALASIRVLEIPDCESCCASRAFCLPATMCQQ